MQAELIAFARHRSVEASWTFGAPRVAGSETTRTSESPRKLAIESPARAANGLKAGSSPITPSSRTMTTGVASGAGREIQARAAQTPAKISTPATSPTMSAIQPMGEARRRATTSNEGRSGEMDSR